MLVTRLLRASVIGAVALLFPTVLPLSGCGGGGINNIINAPTTRAKLTVEWPNRSRASVNAPSSARSFVVTFSQGNPNGGGTIAFPPVNRTATLNAYRQDYTTPSGIRISTEINPLNPNRMNVRFYADPDGTGAIVAETTVSVFISPDGTLISATNNPIGTISLDNKVESVEIPTLSPIVVGGTMEVPFTAKDKNGAVVAVSRGSATFSIVSGESKIGLTADGTLTGKAATDQPGDADGNAQIKVAVDGKESAPAKVTVNFDPADQSVATVEIPTLSTLRVGDTLEVPFIAKNQAGTVLNKARTAATFSVVSGADKINLSTDGNLQALAMTDREGDTTRNCQIKVALEGRESANAKVTITFGPEVATGSGLRYQEIRLPTTNLSPIPGKSVTVNYAGYLASNGNLFDSGSFPFIIDSGRVIAGFNEGVRTMKVGGERRLLIPAALGYGNQQVGSIPPNSDLIFDVQLVSADQ